MTFLLKALHEYRLTDAGFTKTNSVALYMCTFMCAYTSTNAYFQACIKIHAKLKTRWAPFQSWQTSSSNLPCTNQGRSPKTAHWQPASPHPRPHHAPLRHFLEDAVIPKRGVLRPTAFLHLEVWYWESTTHQGAFKTSTVPEKAWAANSALGFGWSLFPRICLSQASLKLCLTSHVILMNWLLVENNCLKKN